MREEKPIKKEPLDLECCSNYPCSASSGDQGIPRLAAL